MINNEVSQTYGYGRTLQRSYGGNPVNPHISLQKQAAAEKDYLERSKAASSNNLAYNNIQNQTRDQPPAQPVSPSAYDNTYQQRDSQPANIERNASFSKVRL